MCPGVLGVGAKNRTHRVRVVLDRGCCIGMVLAVPMLVQHSRVQGLGYVKEGEVHGVLVGWHPRGMLFFGDVLFKRLAGRWPWTTCDVQHAGVWMDPNDARRKETNTREAKKKKLPLIGLRDSFYDCLRSLGGWQ